MTSHERAVEVDTRLADIWSAENDARDRIAGHLDTLHRVDGQKRDTWSRKAPWPVDGPTTEASVRAKLAAGEWLVTWSDGVTQSLNYIGKDAERALEGIDNHRATLAA